MIAELKVWKNRKYGKVDYYLTLMLTGHGYFREYLHRMGKCSSPFCIYEERETMDAGPKAANDSRLKLAISTQQTSYSKNDGE